ncbi:MAG TPA: hypothetical protein VKA67_07545, partial [Verrucomicrobiae bacterium]|nr:hypothetical protein [Verrucomicrobiae bacterium]
MKSNPFTTALTWLLGTSVILSVIFSIQYLFRTRELRSLQSQVAQYQMTQQHMNQLLADLVEYSKHDPAIQPILESVGLKRTPTTSSTKPAAK